MRQFVRSHPVLSFYLLALAICSAVVAAQGIYGIGYAQAHGKPFSFNERLWELLKQFGHGRMYANDVSIAWSATQEPIYWGVFFFGGAPTISALIINWIGWGGAGLKRLFGRLKPWAARDFRGGALATYAVVAVVMFSMVLLHLGIVYNAKSAEAAWAAASIWGLPGVLLPVVFLVGAFIDEGASNEELGWRGFALPVMLEKIKNPLVTALLLGFLWWLWHFPREIPDIVAGKVDWPAFIWNQTVFMGLVICMNVVMTYCFHRTGSVIPAILVHGWGNFATKAVGIWDIMHFDLRLWLFLIAAVLIVLLTRGNLGRRAYLEKRERLGLGSELPA